KIRKSKDCIANVIKRWKTISDQNLLPIKYSGKKPKIDNTNLQYVEELISNNKKNTLNQLTEAWNTNNPNLQVSSKTFHHCLNKLKIGSQ
ncbi:15269_t:CDS:1, partial [Racocetra persica]